MSARFFRRPVVALGVSAALIASLITLTAPAAEAAPTKIVWQTAVPSSATSAFAPMPSQCADLLFIGARGSAETDANTKMSTFGATVQRVRDGLKSRISVRGRTTTVRQVWIDYPAPPVSVLLADVLNQDLQGIQDSVYFDSVQNGVDATRLVLNGSLTRCPSERWILAGYSQGAIVADEIASDPTFDVPSRWGGMFTVADTENFPGRHVSYVGSATKNGAQPTGILTELGANEEDLPSDLQAGSYSYCLSNDVMCSYSAVNLAKAAVPPGLNPHGSYKNDGALKGATAALARRISGLSYSPPAGDATLKDPGLRACVVAQLASSGVVTSNPTPTQLRQLTTLGCDSRYQVGSWEGLQAATSLTNLSTSGPASDLTPIATLPALKDVAIDGAADGRGVSSLAPLRGNTSMERLGVAHSPLADPSPLLTMPHLTGVNLNSDRITDISSLTDAPFSWSAWDQQVVLPATKVGEVNNLPVVSGLHGDHLTPFPLSDSIPNSTSYDGSSGGTVTWLRAGTGTLQWIDGRTDSCFGCHQFAYYVNFSQQVND